MDMQELINDFPVLWDIALRQVHVNIITKYIVAVILVAVLLRLHNLATLRVRNERNTPEDFAMLYLFLLVDAAIAVILVISATRMALNPAFFAMEYVIKWVGG